MTMFQFTFKTDKYKRNGYIFVIAKDRQTAIQIARAKLYNENQHFKKLDLVDEALKLHDYEPCGVYEVIYP